MADICVRSDLRSQFTLGMGKTTARLGFGSNFVDG